MYSMGGKIHAVINTKIFEKYLEQVHERAVPIPKHVFRLQSRKHMNYMYPRAEEGGYKWVKIWGGVLLKIFL